jgi:hypothetical protein
MNKYNALEYIPLVEALAEGRLQIGAKGGGWTDVADNTEVCFTLPPDNYKIRPVESPKEVQ